MDDEPRLDRARAADARDALDRLSGPGEPGEQTYVGRVIDGGNYPTYAPAVHLTVPITLSAEQEKGKPMVATPDPSRTVLAVSLNRIACPGDILVCRRVGAMWVAMSSRVHDCCVCPVPEGPLEAYILFRNQPPVVSGVGLWNTCPWEINIGPFVKEMTQTMLPFGPVPTGKPGSTHYWQWAGDGEVTLCTKNYVTHTPPYPPGFFTPEIPPAPDRPFRYRWRISGQLYALGYRLPRNPPNGTGPCFHAQFSVGMRGYFKDLTDNLPEREVPMSDPYYQPPGGIFYFPRVGGLTFGIAPPTYPNQAVADADNYFFPQGAELLTGECDPFLWTDPPFTDFLKDPLA